MFDVPGSLGYGNTSINKNAFVTGSYCTATFCYSSNAFVRDPQGQITTFEVAGAQKTVPVGIDSNGAIAGFYVNGGGGQGGFLRSPTGQIVTFLATGHVTALNNRGWTLGYNLDPTYRFDHGFAREPDGTTLTLDDPNASEDSGYGTQPFAINSTHYVTGVYEDRNEISHGFIVHPHK